MTLISWRSTCGRFGHRHLVFCIFLEPEVTYRQEGGTGEEQEPEETTQVVVTRRSQGSRAPKAHLALPSVVHQIINKP